MNPSTDDTQRARQAAAEAAAEMIEGGMVVGLGTGDTAAHGIRALARRGLAGLRCVPTSTRSAELARGLGLSVIALDDLPPGTPIDLTFDGADEIDPALRLIKGGGGALLREKLVAHASRRLIIVADAAKRVARLGEKRALPVEIVPFGVPQTLSRLQAVSPGAALRLDQGRPCVTDGGNRVVDVPLPAGADPEALQHQIKGLLGVIETGLFLHEAERVLIGAADGSVLTLRR